MQNQLEEHAPRAAQRNINLNVLRKLTIPTPPLVLQRRYTEIVAAMRSIATAADSSVKTTVSTLRDSLMARLLKDGGGCPLAEGRN